MKKLLKYQTLMMEIRLKASANAILLLASVPNCYIQLSLTLEMPWKTYFVCVCVCLCETRGDQLEHLNLMVLYSCISTLYKVFSRGYDSNSECNDTLPNSAI